MITALKSGPETAASKFQHLETPPVLEEHAALLLFQIDVNRSCTPNPQTKFFKLPELRYDDNFENNISTHSPRLPLPPFPTLQVLKEQLKPIAQRQHIWIGSILQLKRIRHDLDGPTMDRRVSAGFEAKKEVAGAFGVDTEGVSRAFGVGFSVGGEPALCD